MNIKFYCDDEKKGIYCKYTKYEINKEATNFKDLIVVNFRNEYLKTNYRKNCCMLTHIINKFYNRFESRKADGKRRYKELTYDFLCDFLKLDDNKNRDIGCSINQALPFFERYNFGFSVYDMYMNLIYKFEPEKHSEHDLKVLCKDNHIYELNNNLKSLGHIVEKDEININVSDKYNIFDYEKQTDSKIHVIENIDDIVKYVKLYTNDKKENVFLKLITNTDISVILLDLFHNGYTPKVFFNQCIYKLNLIIDYIFITVEMMDVSTQDEAPIYIESVDEYNEYHKVSSKFNEQIITKDHISVYHDSVIEIEDNYKIVPSCGYFEKCKKALLGLDQRKAYTDSLMNINKIPIFGYFDVYRKYNNESIEDYNYYIVECLDKTNETSIIFSNKISRICGFVLKTIDIKYNILYYRKPYKLVDVDFKTPIEKLYKSETIDDDKKKAIVNRLTGMLELKRNKNHQTKFFDDFNHANYYSIKYNGKIFPVSTFGFKEKHEIDQDTGERTIVYENDDKVEMYMVNVCKDKRLRNGFSPIKDIIYCMQKLNLYNNYNKLTKLNIKVYGIKTDSIFFEGNEKIISKNFDLSNKIGNYRIETGKYVSDQKMEILENKLINFIDFDTVNIKEFLDEYNTNEINKYLEENKVIMLKGKFPGVGKTESIKRFGKKTLFILPENTLCRDIKLSGYDSITFSKLFSLYADDVELKNSKTVKVDDYECICFDEIAKHSPERLKRIAEFIKEHPNKYIFGAGDYKQIKPINYNGSQNYLDDCINIIFRNQILLSKIKRLDKKEDVERMEKLYDYIFSSDKIDLLKMCKQFNISYETKYENVKTLNNLAYFNKRCSDISNRIHHDVLNNKFTFFEGLNVICKKYYKSKGILLNTNYTYKIQSIKNGNVIIYDEVDEKPYTINMNMLHDFFILPYCRTIDSSQGRSISDKITIFDLNLSYVSREHLWVAITRCRNLDNVTIFIHSKAEVDSYEVSKINQYFKLKIENYKKQDLKVNRQWEEKDYVDVKFINDQVNKFNMKCSYCLGDLELNVSSFGEVNSNLTLDRKDNRKAHIKSNCVLCCLHCNVSKK